MAYIDDINAEFYESDDFFDFLMEEPTQFYLETLMANRSEDWYSGFKWGYLIAQRDCIWDFSDLLKKKRSKKEKRKGKRNGEAGRDHKRN